MTTEINALILEYKGKIAMCDVHLQAAQRSRNAARQVWDVEKMDYYQLEQREWEARRQAYARTLAEFEALV